MSEVHTRLLRAERYELFPLLEGTSIPDFSRTTVCEGWSVRDVLAHCAAILIQVATRADPYGFTPEENQVAVEERRAWPIADVLAELALGYSLAEHSPAERSPAVAKVALGEWIHGGDVRDALGVPDAYASAGLPEALTLLVERSVARGTPPVDVTLVDATERGLDSAQICLGDPSAEPVGWLRTDTAGLFRIVADRRSNLVERDIVGISLDTLRLFR